MLTFLLDTTCLIAGRDSGDAHHEVARRLIESGAAGHVGLLVAIGVDLRPRDRLPERQEVWQEWLAATLLGVGCQLPPRTAATRHSA